MDADPRPAETVPLPLVHRGKVRDVYRLDHQHLVLVATDRLSAFDVVMAEAVPDKGRVLTAMSAFWFELFADEVPNHLVSTSIDDLPAACRRPDLDGRIMICRRAEMLPIECIVRGYLAGSAWREYREHTTMHGEALPAGLREAERLPDAVFTPSTKATDGHDRNVSFAEAVDLVGRSLAEQARELALAVYRRGAAHAAARGILIADTKLEVGLVDGRLVVADEILTPDSSRFWPADAWTPGATPPSYDKQPVRDHLDALDWDKRPPPPPLSPEVIEATRERYVTAYEVLSGRRFADWPGGGGP